MIVFSKEWFEKYQRPLLWFVNTWIGRRFFYINGDKSSVGKNKITRFGNNFVEWRENGNIVAEFISGAKYAEILYLRLKPLWHLLHTWDMKIANNLVPLLNAGFDTLTVNPDPSTSIDGYAARQNVNQTFSNIRAGAGTHAFSNVGIFVELSATTTSNQYSFLSRAIILFDTSSIGSSKTITSATLSLYDEGSGNLLTDLGDTTVDIVSSTPASNTVIASSDYSNLEVTSFGNLSISSMKSSPNQYHDFTLNASGLENISKTGISKFGARLSWDITGSFTGAWRSGKNTAAVFFNRTNGTSSTYPKLVVTYSSSPPTVTTSAVSNNTSLFSATGNGNVTSDGGDTITERGVVINTTGTPTTSDTKFSTSGTTGAYSVSMTSLIPGTLYYVRAYAINSIGTSYGSEVSFTAVNFLNPTNAYAEDGSFCTAGGDTGAINIQLSGDGGSTWSNTLSKTFNGTNGFLTFGAGSTELWGQAWLGSQVTDSNFRVRVSTGTRTSYTHIWKTFGFAPGSSVILTGIELKIKAKWITDTTSIDVIDVKIYYGSSVLPVVAGSQAYATDAGGGTGALEVYNGSAWKEIVDKSSSQTLTNKDLSDSTNTFGAYQKWLPGDFKYSARRTADTGWLMCDGSAVSRSTYSALFSAIVPLVGTFTTTIASPAVGTLNGHGFNTGSQVYLTTTGALPTGLTANTLYYIIVIDANTFNFATTRANAYAGTKINTSGSQSGTHSCYSCHYGLGDGSTTFNIPDIRGRVMAGNDMMGGTAASRLTFAESQGVYGNMGATGGEQDHTLVVGEMPAHSHGTPNLGSLTNTSQVAGTPIVGRSSGPTSSAGGDGAHNNIQPTLISNVMIKT